MSDPARIYTREYYDRLKSVESRHWWSLGMIDVLDRVMRGRLPEGNGAVLLDVGCGSGVGLAWAQRALPRARRIGIDVSTYGLEHCRDLDATLHLASGEAIPLANETVDLVLCLDVLQHLEDQGPTLREIARVLRPGGLVFLRTNARMWAPPPPGSNLYTPERLSSGLTGAGLQALRLSRANAVGSLVSELGMAWRRWWGGSGHSGGAGHEAHAHCHAGHDHHGHEPTDSGAGDASVEGRGADDAFLGGGYPGGLRLAAENVESLASRCKRALLRREGDWIARGLRLPFGHSLVALARKPSP